MTKYLRYIADRTPNHLGRYVLQFKDSIEWVDNIKDATPDYRQSIDATNDRISNELGVKTSLLEVPDKLAGESKWVITKEE